ncbi:MAG: glycosyltransferase [Campylobacterota bacterium]|nr:glycosyltransferase [Campylobacterota bacterium]
MEKLLYITDQEEYSQRGTIGPLFNDYLKKYLKINMVYVTKYKHSFQQKGEDYIVPSGKEDDIMEYLKEKGVDLKSYDFVFVRNKQNILKNVLKFKEWHQYKVGFRVSYPKTKLNFELLKARKGNNIFQGLMNKFVAYQKQNLANECDLFMPSSFELQNEFYPNVTSRSFPLYSGLDPKKVHSHDILESETTRFVYVGTVDELRQFDVILDAFEKIKDEDWKLVICALNRDYAKELLTFYPNLQDKIELVRAGDLEELDAIVKGCDISFAVLPDISIYNTTFPAKVLDGYSSAIPAMISNNSKNRNVFTTEEVVFSDFDSQDILLNIKRVLNTSKEELKQMGQRGQDKLLHLDRNYEIMAVNLYKELQSLNK